MMSLAIGSLVMVVGVASAVAQGGLFFATKSIKPTLKKLNPFQGIKRHVRPAGPLGGRQDPAQDARSSRSSSGERCAR